MVAGVVLAAGLSSRMGKMKATLPLDARQPGGDTFLTNILRTFHTAGIDEVVVVVGHEAEAVVSSVYARGLSPRFIVNDRYTSGQLSSVLAGVRAVDRPEVDAMLMTLVDVPLVAASTVRAVVSRFYETRAPIVRPVADENGVQGARHGHPVLISRTLFSALAEADPAAGAKSIVRANVTAAGSVEVTDDGAFLDVDTPADYDRLFSRSE